MYYFIVTIYSLTAHRGLFLYYDGDFLLLFLFFIYKLDQL